MLVLREAFYGATRFDEFAERTGLSEPITSARLRELVAAGLLRREPYQEPGARTRQLYRLTEMGAELLPALVALMQWGDRWLQADGRAPIELHHEECGGRVHAELRCEHGHRVGAGGAGRRPRAAAGGGLNQVVARAAAVRPLTARAARALFVEAHLTAPPARTRLPRHGRRCGVAGSG